MDKRNLVNILVVTLIVGGIIGLTAVNATSGKTTQDKISENIQQNVDDKIADALGQINEDLMFDNKIMKDEGLNINLLRSWVH